MTAKQKTIITHALNHHYGGREWGKEPITVKMLQAVLEGYLVELSSQIKKSSSKHERELLTQRYADGKEAFLSLWLNYGLRI